MAEVTGEDEDAPWLHDGETIVSPRRQGGRGEGWEVVVGWCAVGVVCMCAAHLRALVP